MSEQPINVHDLRENFLKEIEHKVESAYLNRKDIKSQVSSAVSSGKKGIRLEKLHGNAKVVLKLGDVQPNEVTVKNSHDYKDLLRVSLSKTGALKPEILEDMSAKILKHEYEHHVPGLGQKDLEIEYGVAFLEDKVRGEIYVQPFIRPIGSTTASVARKILGAPEELSVSDKIMLRRPQ